MFSADQGVTPVSGKTYVEDVFSTYLYVGNMATQTISNGIDLAGNGGMVWTKARSANSYGNSEITDTVRGENNAIYTSDGANAMATDAQAPQSDVTGFTSSGFSLRWYSGGGNWGDTPYASWTFRKQPKFFDVVTYTGNGTQYFPGRSINHNLGSVPGCIIIKNLSRPTDWHVEHIGANQWIAGSYVECLALNSTYAQSTSFFGYGLLPVATDTTFNVAGTNDNALYPVNFLGDQYVAYLFAHNAGGFGLAGTDSVISCGSYTGNGSQSGPVISLGWEPQWLMVKSSNATGNWVIFDNMRGMPVSGTASKTLYANASGAEIANSSMIAPLSNGFQPIVGGGEVNVSGTTYVYIAIRRGPMKTPTSGTSVFIPNAVSGSVSAGTAITTNFPVDMQISKSRTLSGYNYVVDRLRGVSTTATELGISLQTSSTNPESATPGVSRGWSNTGWLQPSYHVGDSRIAWNFRRAPGFFDVVCYTGTGASNTVNHNLGVQPELIIFKSRNFSGTVKYDAWSVLVKKSGTDFLFGTLSLAFTDACDLDNSSSSNFLTNQYFSSYIQSYFSIDMNTNGRTYVAYLFASLPGISKVGSYTGNGTSQTINCGFSAGTRFVLVKRTDSTGDWYVWDSARGIVPANDPHLSLNTSSTEVTTDDSVDPDNSGFIVNQVAATNINVTSATYIFLAIA